MKHDIVSDNARLVADSALDFAKGSGGISRARAVRDNRSHLDKDVWKDIVDLGWLGIGVSEDHGGLGLGADVTCALLESVGRMLLPEPVVSSIAAAILLAECDTGTAADLLAELMAGKRLCVPVKAKSTMQNYPLQLMQVPDCNAGANLLLAQGKGDAFQLRAVDINTTGVRMRMAECVDGSLLSDLVIEQSAWTQSTLIAQGPLGQSAFDKACDMMLLGYSAYLVGLMDEALQLTISYMKLRSQFGSPIGAFQALQHRAASCHVDIASCRALVYEACNAFHTGMRARAAAAAKARSSGAALRVTKECVQFHGAIGFADEHDIGLYLRKAATFAARQGGEMEHKLRYAELTHSS
jgi:alkylation response protein AidB-like acyl-CoA dehydrogenase